MYLESLLMPASDSPESYAADSNWASGEAAFETSPLVESQDELPVTPLQPAEAAPSALSAPTGTPAPSNANPHAIKTWFDGLMDNAIPEPDGTLATARRTADTLARLAKSDNTRRAYRAGVRAWCDWCHKHDLPALPASPADVAAFLSEQRYPAPPGRPLGVNTLKLRAASIRYLHYLARLPSPTGTADVGETLTGITRVARQAGNAPRPKLATRIAILREMVAVIGDDLPGLRDRALLLLGFAGAFRRAELARIELGHIEETEHGLRITLPVSKGDRAMLGVQVGIPYGSSELCPVRALRRWLQASGIAEGAIFRRVWATPRPANPAPGWAPIHVVGTDAIDPGTVARIIKARGKAAGFDADLLSGHSLKRGAMNTAKDRRVHPTQLKQLGRHANYATLGAYLDEGDLFEDNALNGVL